MDTLNNGEYKYKLDVSDKAVASLKQQGATDVLITTMKIWASVAATIDAIEKGNGNAPAAGDFNIPQTTAKPDQWRGLILDESSPIDALKALGKPEREKTDKITAFVEEGFLDSPLDPELKKKNLKVLVYKKPEGFEEAQLAFLDEKLIAIKLHKPKTQVRASSLSTIYGIPFAYAAGNRKGVTQYEVGSSYWSIGASSRSAIFARIVPIEKSLKEELFGGGIQNRHFDDQDGTVDEVRLVSQKLENQRAKDLFK